MSNSKQVSFNVPSNVLRALMNSSGKNDVRFYLNGIFLDPEGILIGTNGHVMVKYDIFAHASCGNEHTNPDEIKAAFPNGLIFLPGKITPYNDKPILITVSDQVQAGGVIGSMFSTNNIISHVSKVEGSFPDWRRADAWNTEDDDNWVSGLPDCGMNVGYLYNISRDGWRFWYNKKNIGLKTGKAYNGSLRCIPIVTGVQDVRVTLMPMRL